MDISFPLPFPHLLSRSRKLEESKTAVFFFSQPPFSIVAKAGRNPPATEEKRPFDFFFGVLQQASIWISADFSEGSKRRPQVC